MRDVGAVHERLLPGRVVGTGIDGVERFHTFPDGHVIRELIVSIDDQARRLAYSVVDGARPALDHHHASFEVRDEGERGRLIGITDILPDTIAPQIRIRTEFAIAEIEKAIEGATTGDR